MFGCVDELGAGFAIPFVFGYFVDEYRVGSKVDVEFVDNTRLLLWSIRGFCTNVIYVNIQCGKANYPK